MVTRLFTDDLVVPDNRDQITFNDDWGDLSEQMSVNQGVFYVNVDNGAFDLGLHVELLFYHTQAAAVLNNSHRTLEIYQGDFETASPLYRKIVPIAKGSTSTIPCTIDLHVPARQWQTGALHFATSRGSTDPVTVRVKGFVELV